MVFTPFPAVLLLPAAWFQNGFSRHSEGGQQQNEVIGKAKGVERLVYLYFTLSNSVSNAPSLMSSLM